MSNVTIIVQARMGSTRLPGKIMIDIVGKPMLAHIIERLMKTELAQGIVVATTIREIDEPVVRLAGEWGAFIFRGSEEDVLDRYYQAAQEYDADIIVRITADCALIDPHVVDKCIRCYLENNYDYISNTLKRTYPDGLDVEVFSYSVLEKAWHEANLASEREHVTPYVWKHPLIFKLANVENKVDLSNLRWVVDREKDLEFVRQIYSRLYKEGNIFYMEDILELLQECPDLGKMNEGITYNEGYSKSIREDRILE